MRLVSDVLTFLVFFLIVTPIGLVLRIFGYKPLAATHIEELDSYRKVSGNGVEPSQDQA